MEFKKENFNGFFKVTLDTVLSSNIPNCTEDQKIGHYKTVVSKFHYFVYYTLLKKSVEGNSFTKKALQILGPLFEKVKAGKFEVKIGRDKFEVSLETISNIIIVNAKDTLNKIEGATEGNTPIDFGAFFTFFIKKNFETEDQIFISALKDWSTEVLANANADPHISNILQAFLDSEEKKLFHNETESRGFTAYTGIGESVQKQSISTNAGWMERFQWIIDAFSSRLAGNPPSIGTVIRSGQVVAFNDLAPEFRIFVGPPGCGKTREVKNLVTKNNQEHVLIQIHPSYGYEDLVEGLKPLNFPDGQVRYDIVEGPLRVFAHMASNKSAKILCLIRKKEGGILVSLPIGATNRFGFKKLNVSETPFSGPHEATTFNIISDELFLPDEFISAQMKSIFDKTRIEDRFVAHLHFRDISWGTTRYAIVLDELNRGNVPQLLGELIYLLGEEGAESTLPVKLQYSQEDILWPSALSIYATMNSADVSTDRLDQAVKRRFAMTHIGPDKRIFSHPQDNFGFLVRFNHRVAEIVKDFKPIETLNGLFAYCGAEATPQTILADMNGKVLAEASAFGVSHPHEKLLGHSYLLKICRRTADKLMGKESPDLRSAILFFESLEIVKEEVIPALASILNADETELNRFLTELTAIKEKDFSAYELSDVEKFVEKLVFKQPAKVTSLKEYRDLRNTKWPNAA